VRYPSFVHALDRRLSVGSAACARDHDGSISNKGATVMTPAFLISLVVFAFAIVVIAKLGGDAADWLANLWIAPTLPDRPQGVQEEDLPPFVFGDRLRVG
jgi:hypothetical protein